MTAFALAGSTFAPVRWFHQDAIRIPMLLLAVVGAFIDLAVLAWMARLRGQDSSQWRRRQRNTKEIRSERLQVALAILTLVLVGTEVWNHIQLHGPKAQTAVRANGS